MRVKIWSSILSKDREVHERTAQINDLCEYNVDGDCMWGVSIKEMSMARAMKNLLPRATMMGFGDPIVTDVVRLTSQENVTMYSWLNDGVYEQQEFIEI